MLAARPAPIAPPPDPAVEPDVSVVAGGEVMVDRAAAAPPPATDPVAEVPGAAGRALDAIWAWLAGRPGPVFGALLVLFTLLRTGATGGASDATLLAVRTFPEPIADYRANSIIGPAVGHLVGATDEASWVSLHLLVIAFAIVVVAACLVSRFGSGATVRIAAAWIALSAVAPSVLKKIGSYDPWTVIGASLVVLPRRHRLPLGLLGGALLGAANAEQGLVGLGAAAVLVAALPQVDGSDRRRELQGLAWGAVGLVAVRAATLAWWAHLGAEVPSRAAVFGEYLAGGVERSLGAGLAGAYAWYGVAWAIVLTALLAAARTRAMTPTRWLAVVGALVAVPAVATITTLDGTRVFAMVSFPALLVTVTWLLGRAASSPAAMRFLQRLTTGALVAAILLPPLVTDTGGGSWFMLPWGSPG